ncbi:MAG: GAF domain-containing protein, partial [Anaerolineales bacterium]
MRSSLPNETVEAGLLEVTQAAQTALSVSELMEAVAQSLPMLAGCDRCALFLWEAEAEGFRLTYQYPARPNKRLAFPRSGLIRPDAVPLAAQVRASLQPFVVHADELRRPRPLRWVKALKLQSLLIAPLHSGDRLIGALALAHNPALGPITAHRLSVLDSLGRQLATAIQRVQLFETVQRQVQELTILHAVATAGAEATSEDALIERATQVIGGTLYPQNFGVLLLDHGAGMLHVHPSYRLAASFMETRGVPLGQGIVGQVAATGHPVRVPDVTRNPNYIAADPQTRSELCVPLKIGERILGVINVESIRRDAFTETDERVLTTLAGQLATAIEKLRLFTQIQQREAELSTLLEVARAVSASLEPQAVLLQVATSMARALRMERCGLSSYDPLTRMVRTLAVYDISGQQDTGRTNEAFSLADYPATACALEQEAVLVIRADDPASDPAEVELLRVYGDAVVLMMALRAGGQVEGLAELYTRDAGRKFAPDELRLARALADQAGLALSNARFYQAEHEQRELAEALREAGTTLGASLDFDTVLDRLMEQIARVTPYDAGNVMLVEDS